MRKLIRNWSVFIVILIMIKMPFAFFYQNELNGRRSEFAEREFNTVFIGSSRTKNAVIPDLFDVGTNHSTDSYNFGISSGLPPQTFYWCKELMRTKSSLKYVFFELSGGMDEIPVYETTLSGFSVSAYVRALTALPYHKSSIYHDKLILAFLKPELPRPVGGYNAALDRPDGETAGSATPEDLRASLKLHQRMESEPGGAMDPVDERYWQRINELINLAGSKHVHIYFYIPPRMKTESEFKILYPIYHRLDPKYKFRTAHDDESLHRQDSSSDEFHLNYEGAVKFTKSFAKAFNEINFGH